MSAEPQVTPKDEPHRFVIVLEQLITCAEATELGKVLGSAGYTGRFVGGSVADLVALGARARKEGSTLDG